MTQSVYMREYGLMMTPKMNALLIAKFRMIDVSDVSTLLAEQNGEDDADLWADLLIKYTFRKNRVRCVEPLVERECDEQDTAHHKHRDQ